MIEQVYDISDRNLPAHLFEPLPESEKHSQDVIRTSRTYLQDAWIRFKKNKLAMTGMIIVAIITLFAIFGPMISKYTYDGMDSTAPNQGSSMAHWFGTDKFGRDLWVRCMYGARISLLIGFSAAIINMLIGSLYGGISGYFGGKVDMVMMRIVEIIYGIPQLCYVILAMMFLGNSVGSVLVALCVTYWISTARTVRSTVLSIRNEDFILAAIVTGESDWNIISRHLIPNCIGSVIVSVTFLVPQAIFLEAFLSFLGIGIQVPKASWGTLANAAIETVVTGKNIHLMIFPALLISITVFALNFVGDGLRDALDPKIEN